MSNLLRSLVVFAMLCVSATATADVFYDTYQRGLTAFKAKDYANARAEFLRAYDLRPEPIVLFNIAQTYRLEQNSEQALDYYKRFLAESKIAEDLRSEAQGYVAELEAQRAARDAQKKIEANAGPKERDGTPVNVTTPPMDRPLPTSSTTHTSDPTSGPSDVSDRKRRVPTGSWVALGVGGAGLVSAIVLGKLGLNAERDLKNNPMATQTDADRVEHYQTAINVSWGIAGAAAVAGVVIYFAAPAYTSDRKSIVVAPNRDGGWAASVTGRF